MTLICSCGQLLIQSTSRKLLWRALSTSRRCRGTQFYGSNVIDDGPAAQARRAAEDNARSRVGPFPFVGGQPVDAETPRRPWSQLARGQKVGRSFVNTTNAAFVIVFGLGLSGLVGYAVFSELYASNSPTRLFEEASALVLQNAEVQAILLPPLRCHAELGGGRRQRRIRSSISVDRLTGREQMTIRFFVEGTAPEDADNVPFLQRAKAWVRPVIVEPSDPSALLPSTAMAPSIVASESAQTSTTGWLRSVFASVLPSRAGTTAEKPMARLARIRPQAGVMSAGEAIATFLMDDAGIFKLTNLVVYYPNTRQQRWTTSIVDSTWTDSQNVVGATRYRFWRR